ncbi:hypothetical protein ACFL3V_06095 [Nanoarchaeota archaeon]
MARTSTHTYLVLILFLFTLTTTGCTQEEQLQKQIDKLVAEEVKYTSYSSSGFSVSHPYWPNTADQDSKVEVSVTMGYCTAIINSEKMSAEHLYQALKEGVEDSGNELIISDNSSLRVKYSAEYKNLTMLSDTTIFSCNGFAHAVSVVCIAQADNRSQHIHNKVFGSAKCEETTHEIVGKLQETSPPDTATNQIKNEKITYKDFEEDDFVIEHPDWTSVDDNTSERVLGVSIGICSVFVNKHNALPKDLAFWIKKTITEKADHTMLKYRNDQDTYYIDYSFPYEQHTLTAKTKILYCNYMSYATVIACIDNQTTSDIEDMQEKVLESTDCTREYEIPTPKAVEEKKQEVKQEEPEVIEEIEDDIIRTDAGEEFGIDEEMVVYFINSNTFFRKIMKDFPKANLVFEDKDNDRELELRVKVDRDGKITRVEDGKYDDADVTLVLPLRDALNIFNNAQNINPITLIGFAINVKTIPSEIKNQVIQKVLQGKYND